MTTRDVSLIVILVIAGLLMLIGSWWDLRKIPLERRDVHAYYFQTVWALGMVLAFALASVVSVVSESQVWTGVVQIGGGIILSGFGLASAINWHGLTQRVLAQELILRRRSSHTVQGRLQTIKWRTRFGYFWMAMGVLIVGLGLLTLMGE